MNYLVTGGAGYIGSHVVDLLLGRGDSVVVVDDLSNGFAERLGSVPLVEMDLAADSAREKLATVLKEYSVDAVIHFAARKQVWESVEEPTLYYRNNVAGLSNVLDAMRLASVQRLVFSSSAAVYGMVESPTVAESTRCQPINPYGETKLVGEWMTAAAEKSWGLKTVNLRYFNVAGNSRHELADRAALNLIPIVVQKVIAGERPTVFGDDYDTPDGTCIRDYVHVVDLAEAHLVAVDSTLGDGFEPILNVGTGQGASVMEVIREVGRVAGHEIEPLIVPRRAGDPARVVADSRLIGESTGWSAALTLRDIVESTWDAMKLSADS